MYIESSEISWAIFYVVQYKLVSVALGVWTMHLPRILSVPRLTRFLIGYCFTPFFLGFWMMAATGVIPGASRWIYLLLPSLCALITLVLDRGRTLHRLYRELRRVYRSTLIPWFNYLILLSALVLVGCVVVKLYSNAIVPLTGHDALTYAGKALRFAQERKISAITGVYGAPDGAYRADFHGFLFPAFLSHALLASSSDALGFPHDFSLRISFQITFLSMLLSLVALGGIVRTANISVMAVIVLLQTPQLDYISFASSRDAYRIIPLLLLAALLACLASRASIARLRISQLLPLGGLATCSLFGHTLGGIIVVLLGGIWLIWGLAQKAPWPKLMLVCTALGLGLLVGGTRYLDLIINTGSVMGQGSGGFAIANTPLEVIAKARVEAATASGEFPLWRLVFALDEARVSVPGIISALFIMAIWVLDRRRRLPITLPLMALFTCIITIPYLGVFDFSGYQLSSKFTENIRYSLHWYPFLAVSIALFVNLVYRSLVAKAKLFPLGAVLVFIAVWSYPYYIAFKTVTIDWRTQDSYTDSFLSTLRSVQTVLARLPPEQRLFLDDDRYNYYLDGKALVFYTEQTWPLLQAPNPRAAGKRLYTANIKAVALQERDIPGWWDQLPLFDYIANPNRAVLVDGPGVRIYYLADTSTERTKWLADYIATTTLMLAVDQLQSLLFQQTAPFCFKERICIPISTDSFVMIDDPNALISYLKSTLVDNTNNTRELLSLGLIHRAAEDFGSAIYYFEEALRTGLNKRRIQILLTDAYLAEAASLAEVEQFDQASALLYKVVSDPSLMQFTKRQIISAYRAWGYEHFDSSLTHLIFEQLSQASELTSSDISDLLTTLASSPNISLEVKIRATKQLLAVYPNDVDIHAALGYFYAKQNNWTAATNSYLKLIELAPNSPSGYMGLAALHEHKGDIEKAINLYRVAITNTHGTLPYLALGKLYLSYSSILGYEKTVSESPENTEKAVAIYEAILHSDPNVHAYRELGDIYIRQQKITETISIYQRAVHDNPDQPWPHIELGQLYLMQVSEPK